MDPQKITELANLLRNNGDKVLNSEFKLTLTGSLLRALNDSFTLIADSSELASNQSFQVVKPNNSKSNVFRDLQLVHDFVQKTLILCITHYVGEDYFDGVIDISKFRSLKRLEVQKTNVKQIIGIQPLRSQIQQLICVRSLKSVVEIITHCGGDNSNGFVWNELKVADFSYNNLQTVDCSLEFAQYLQHLNLRHNQLVTVEAIKWLPNLKTLDLSYNRLTLVPNFHLETSKRLQCLNLSNNFIEDLIGISKLDSLTDLDLSDNCLLDHNSLYPLSALMTLKYLNLYGNALFCHPKHRLATSQFLHKNTSTVKFILDYEPLSKSEKALTGTHQNTTHSGFTSKYTLKSNSRATPLRNSSSNQTPASSVGSTTSLPNSVSGEDEGIDMTSSVTEKIRRVKVRQVVIECPDQNSEDTATTELKTKPTPTVKVNEDHLETKKQFEILRNKYGAGWLQKENAEMVHSVLGLSPSKTPIATSSDNEMTDQQTFEDYLGEINKKHLTVDDDNDTKMISSTPVNDSALVNSSASVHNRNASDTEYTSAYESMEGAQENQTLFQTARDEEENTEETKDLAPHLQNIYDVNTVDEPELSDPEEDEETYIVYTLDKKEAVFLTVSANYIREKDSLNQRTKAKWSLKILESCDRIKSNTLRINFDTIKSDKKERVYTVEEGLCQELEKKLRAILSKRDLFEMNQKIYRCINCSCQFSHESTPKDLRKRDVFCPDCKSSFVTEIHSMPKSLEKVKNTPPKVILEAAVVAIEARSKDEEEKPTTSKSVLPEDKRESSGEPENSMHGSAGKGPSRLTANNKLSRSLMQSLNQSSINSLNESSSCSKISHSQSSFDSNQSVAGSSTTDRENDFKSNCESDVDIISNPSQSSIEVLDHGRTSRKNSEENKANQPSQLQTIEDSINKTVDQGDGKLNVQPQSTGEAEKKSTLGQVQLTESSSSGSVTDSVCTTYEQGDVSSSEGPKDVKKIPAQAEESTKKEESMLSTMFGGLLQSTNLLMSRTTQRFIDSESSQLKCEKYKFNYIDFSDVDHRLKLYFYQTKFEEQTEHFKWIVKGKIYNENSGTIIDGLVVMSTIKCYVMEAFAPENDNVSKWLRPVVSVTVDRLESIQLLPWKVGLGFSLRDWGGFLLLLQDIIRTDSLLFHFTKNVLPSQCELKYQISEKVLNRLTNTSVDEQIKMFSLLSACEVKSDETVQTFNMLSLFTTDSRLFLTTPSLSWLTPISEASIQIGFTQSMSNLVDVERPEENVFAINFLDETLDKSEFWKCKFETRENAESCLNAIGQSWEKLFGVSLLNN